MNTVCQYCGDHTHGNNSGMCDTCDRRMNGRLTGRPLNTVRITDMGDGEVVECTLPEFLANNETLSEQELSQLKAGDCLELGGGAGEWIQVQLV